MYSYYRGYDMLLAEIVPNWAVIAALVVALGLTVLICVTVLPARRRDRLNPFLRVLSDFFNMRKLLLERILRVMFVFSTCLTEILGFLTIVFTIYLAFRGRFMVELLLGGVGIMLLGPFVLRIVYEALMMMIMLVKNVMEINRKMGGDPVPPAPKETAAPRLRPTEPPAPYAARNDAPYAAPRPGNASGGYFNRPAEAPQPPRGYQQAPAYRPPQQPSQPTRMRPAQLPQHPQQPPLQPSQPPVQLSEPPQDGVDAPAQPGHRTRRSRQV